MPPKFPKRVANAYLSDISSVFGLRMEDSQSWGCGELGIPDVEVCRAVRLRLGNMKYFVLFASR